MSLNAFEQVIEHAEQQLPCLAFPRAQFLPGIPETLEQRYLRRLRECGVFGAAVSGEARKGK